MKLDVTVMKSMTPQDYRVLSAVEYGMETHELVPASLIPSLAQLRHGGTHKILSTLLRDQLLSHDQSCGYNGYRVTNAGQDILALHHLKKAHHVHALGRKIGTGKESDVYLAVSLPPKTDNMEDDGIQVVAKFHRLGRTSFRNVKKKRDYFFVHSSTRKHVSHQPHSWLFLSTLSAKKEFAFMKALHEVGIPTPIPIACNRHVVVMSLVRGMPLYQIHPSVITKLQAKNIFQQSIHLVIRLLAHGLIHCDLNEFNLLVDLSGVQEQVLQREHTEKQEEEEEDDDDLGTRISRSTRHTKYIGSSSVAEYYVRHSGKSLAGKGALSIHGTWTRTEPSDQVLNKPKHVLNEEGEAKPIVTLIDFPQMISINHPNARELFERDVEGLRRFFGNKLDCPSMTLDEYLQDDEDDDASEGQSDLETDAVIIPSWDDLVKKGVDGEMMYQPSTNAITISGIHASDEESMMKCSDPKQSFEEDLETISKQTLSLVAKRQGRIDQLLKVSGFSQDDAARDLELYYFQNPSQQKEIDEHLNENDDEIYDEDESYDDYDVNDECHDDQEEKHDYIKEYTNISKHNHIGSIKDDILSDLDGSVSLSAMTLEQKEASFVAEMQERVKARVIRQLQKKKRMNKK